MKYITIFRCNNCASIFSTKGSEQLTKCHFCEKDDLTFTTLKEKLKLKFNKLYHKNRETMKPKLAFTKAIEEVQNDTT